MAQAEGSCKGAPRRSWTAHLCALVMVEAQEQQQGQGPGDAPLCWVCMDADREEPYISPCQCRGTVQFVHASCIQTWLDEHRQRVFGAEPRCSLCLAPYNVLERPASRRDFLRAHLTGVPQRFLRFALPMLVLALVMWAQYCFVSFPSVLICLRTWAGPGVWTQPAPAAVGVVLYYCAVLRKTLVVRASSPLGRQAPENRLLRLFYQPQVPQNFVEERLRLDGYQRHMMKVHVWVLLLAALATLPWLCVPRADDIKWCFLPSVLPPLLLHRELRTSRWMCQCARAWVGGVQQLWQREYRRVICHPMRSFLQVAVAGMALEAALCGLMLVVALASSFGVLFALATLGVMWKRGPSDELWLLPRGDSEHCLWIFLLFEVVATQVLLWLRFAKVLTFALGRQNAVWQQAALIIGSVWALAVLSIAAYANVAMARRYVQRWRRQHGEVLLTDAAEQELARPPPPAQCAS